MPGTAPRPWKLFAAGLLVRLFGVGLIWLGDGDDGILRKSLVVVGVILLIGGTTILRYLLLSGPVSTLSARIKKKLATNGHRL